MARYVAFDVETPNRANDRMSAIGVSVIEDGAIVEEFYSLVDPEEPFDAFNVNLTGIDEDAVRGAPTFEELWPQLEPLLSEGMLVAHNAWFDLTVLKHCLRAYDIEWRPYTRYMCTVQMGRKLLPGMKHRLNDMCDYYCIPLDHHKAASDAHACAEILLHYFADGADPRNHIRTYSFNK